MVETPVEFRWTAHPLRERRGAAIVAILLISGVTLAAYVAGDGEAWTWLAAPILVLSLNRFFMPSRYEIDDQGITAKYPFGRCRWEWQDVGRWSADTNGAILILSPTAPPRRHGKHGLQILFGVERTAVLERLRLHLDERDES